MARKCKRVLDRGNIDAHDDSEVSRRFVRWCFESDGSAKRSAISHLQVPNRQCAASASSTLNLLIRRQSFLRSYICPPSLRLSAKMTVNLEDSKFFEEKKEQFVILRGTAHVDDEWFPDSNSKQDPPKFDLDSYISNYDGKRIQRMECGSMY